MKKVSLVAIIGLLICSLAFGATLERRLIGREDINWGHPDNTFQDSLGTVFHKIDNTYSLPAPLVNVRAYGAVLDNVTDDLSAIHMAIDNTYNNGGGFILVPGHAYVSNSVLMKSGVYLMGIGVTASSIRTDSNNPVVKFFGASTSDRINNTGVLNTSLIGKGSQQSGQYGIHAKHATHNLQVSNTDIKYCGDYAVYLEKDTYLFNYTHGSILSRYGLVKISGLVSVDGSSNANIFNDIYTSPADIHTFTGPHVLLTEDAEANVFNNFHFEAFQAINSLISIDNNAIDNYF